MRRIIITALMLATAGFTGAALAQQKPGIFGNPSNLQVLPKDISAEELRSTMRGFALGLGVRCTHCHQGEEGQPLSTLNFAADVKETKRIARQMLAMVSVINGTVTGLGRGAEHKYVEVTCTTCHRGQNRPWMIEDILQQTLEENSGDVEAVGSKYRELRESYYGGFAYDFGEFPLSGFAFGLDRQGQVEGAITLLKLNAEFHPESTNIPAGLGSVYENAGKLELAAESYRRALEINPGNGFAAGRLKAVEEAMAGGDAE